MALCNSSRSSLRSSACDPLARQHARDQFRVARHRIRPPTDCNSHFVLKARPRGGFYVYQLLDTRGEGKLQVRSETNSALATLIWHEQTVGNGDRNSGIAPARAGAGSRAKAG